MGNAPISLPWRGSELLLFYSLRVLMVFLDGIAPSSQLYQSCILTIELKENNNNLAVLFPLAENSSVLEADALLHKLKNHILIYYFGEEGEIWTLIRFLLIIFEIILFTNFSTSSYFGTPSRTWIWILFQEDSFKLPVFTNFTKGACKLMELNERLKLSFILYKRIVLSNKLIQLIFMVGSEIFEISLSVFQADVQYLLH